MVDLFLLALCIIFIYFIYFRRKFKKIPPGAVNWPIVRNFIQVDMEPLKSVMALRKKHGHTIGIDLEQSNKRIMYNNYEHHLFKAACNSHRLCGHFLLPTLTINGNISGMANVSIRAWMEQWRFVFSNIQAGFRQGRRGVPVEVETKTLSILNEVNAVIVYLSEICGRPFSIAHTFNVPVLNIFWGAEERYSLRDPKMLKILNRIYEYIISSAAVQMIFVFLFKWFKIFPRVSGYQHYRDNYLPVMAYIKGAIAYHRKTCQEGIQGDLTNCCLKNAPKTSNTTTPSFYGTTEKENLHTGGLHDIYIRDTTSHAIRTYIRRDTASASTLRWTLFFMANNLEVQEKLHNIISTHMQQRTQPSLQDRQITSQERAATNFRKLMTTISYYNWRIKTLRFTLPVKITTGIRKNTNNIRLPFVEALVMEVLRMSSIRPPGVIYEAMEETTFKGNIIPKSTLLIGNLSGVHDPEVWGDPEKFRPERFLNDDETEIIRHPALITVSTGRNICFGETLTREELFLFTMLLFHSFKVEFDAKEPIPAKKYEPGKIFPPAEHKLIFSERCRPLKTENKEIANN